jgi:hypothetical protein
MQLAILIPDGELTGGKCKVPWPKVCTPQPNGGLGIKDLEYFSQALRLRWLWFAWDSRQRPWEGLQVPVTDEDRTMFNAATVVQLGNGKTASWNSCGLNGRRWLRAFRCCTSIAGGKIERWRKQLPTTDGSLILTTT